MILEIRDLSKNYGKNEALKDVSLIFQEGEIVGLYGPNGNGKTTLLKLISGLLRPSKGNIFIDGKEIGIYAKSMVSFLLDTNIVPLWMRVKDAVNFYSDFFKDFDRDKFKELSIFFNLPEKSRVKELSKGFVERLNLSLCLSRKAKIYLLDEPLGGVDPLTRDRILNSILRSYHEESLMIISTHLVGEVEKVTDRTIFISKGKIILDENTEEIRKKNKSVDVLFKEIFGKEEV